MSEEQTSYTEQPPAGGTDAPSDAPIVFLGIGVIINLVLISAYFVWAYRQTRKPDVEDD